MRTICVVTVARSDYGIFLPILRHIQSDPDLQLYLIVTGMHLAPEFGLTVQQIEADGFDIAERLEMLIASDTPSGIGLSMGIGVTGFARLFARFRPDILLVLGDRFETITAPLAALPFKIPIAHIHGGEITEGAIDDALRHTITKLSHLHFVSTEDYGRRVIQMGEEPWRVTVAGAPSLDNLKTIPLLSPEVISERWGLALDPAPLLVTFHPVTMEYEQTEWQSQELLTALSNIQRPIIFTLPNADTNGRIIIRHLQSFVLEHPTAKIVENLGTQGYFSLMKHAAAMIGNSSSGIIEAASFELPVVNIGNRQKGRTQAKNVINTGYSRNEIAHGIQQALDPAFRSGLDHLVNPYGTGDASEKIVSVLKTVDLGSALTSKKFYDLPLVND